MIQIIDKVKCCGCNACGDVCPKDAITFKTDIEGFWYPEVNMDRCIDCGLCEKVCPIIQVDKLKNDNLEGPECWALQHKNLESLFNSTSGSAFAAFAERMYKEEGYVGGAIYNDDYSVQQFISADKKDLEKIRNSKYVQSDSSGFYKAVRDILKQGHNVLVCGLPCQIAALKSYLHSDYENLITIDLICRGINSPKILKGYISYLEEKYASKIIYFKAKSKEVGWRKLTTKIVFENGEVLYDTLDRNYFTVGYLQTGVYCRPSCYDCKFKGCSRIGDITIGDFWGAEHSVDATMDHDLGTSVVLLNSNKGKNFFGKIQDKVKIQHVSIDKVLACNPAIISSLNPPVIDRDRFYRDLDSLPFRDVASKYIKLPFNSPLTIRKKIKNILRFILSLKKCCGWNIWGYCRNVYYNFCKSQIQTNILKGNYILLYKHSIIDLSKTAKIQLGGVLRLGTKRVRGSKLESRLLVDNNGTLSTSGDVTFLYGADIEVFYDACLEIGADFVSNINATIICGKKITIGDRVCLGRDVTIRDNNGEHFISRRTYKPFRPVFIGQHSWLCEGSIIMPGTELGVGVIVGARSMVSGKFKNFTMLSGSPAEVIDEDVYFKM